jgi:hypothetical protein
MWEHKGFKIEVNNEGKFIAESEDDHFEANTLDVIKRTIDNATSKVRPK